MAVATPRTVGGGRYHLLARMGIGGHAAVYRVYDSRLKVERAIKVLLPEFARRKNLRARFESEAQAMATLDHRLIVRVVDVVPDAPLPFIVMELLPGGTLATWVQRHGPMPPRLAVRCALQIAAALQAAHASGIIHRDVKPHNVLIDANGRCKLGDFGIARAEGGVRTREGAVMGTEGYMAPEQGVDANAVDERADVYGLAMTLWVCMTGLDPIRLLRTDGFDRIHPALRSAIQRGTSEDPEARPRTVESLAAQLKLAAAALPSDPEAPPLVQEVDELGQVDNFDEIASLVDEGAPVAISDGGSSGSDPVPTYVMPSTPKVPLSATPEWVERVQAPAAGGFTLGRPAHRPTPQVQPRPLARSLIRIAAQIGIPGMLALTLVALLMLVGHLQLRGRANEVLQARTSFGEVLRAEIAVLSDVEALGGNPMALETHWAAWQDTSDPALRAARGLALVSELELVADQLRAPGSNTWAVAEARLQRVVTARDELVRTRDAYHDAWESTLGWMAVGAPRLTIHPPPTAGRPRSP